MLAVKTQHSFCCLPQTSLVLFEKLLKKKGEKMNKVNLKDFFCEECSLQFGKKLVFDLHLSLVHGKKANIKQENKICETTAEKSEPSVSNDRADQSFQCHICLATFSTNHSFKRHIASVHEGKRPFKCDTCDTKFAAKQYLNIHVAAIHKGRKPFKCGTCDACFTQKGSTSPLFMKRRHSNVTFVTSDVLKKGT